MDASNRQNAYWIMIQLDMLKFDYKAKDAEQNWLDDSTFTASTVKCQRGIVLKHKTLPEGRENKYKYPPHTCQSPKEYWDWKKANLDESHVPMFWKLRKMNKVL